MERCLDDLGDHFICNSLRISLRNVIGTGGKDKDPLFKDTLVPDTVKQEFSMYIYTAELALVYGAWEDYETK